MFPCPIKGERRESHVDCMTISFYRLVRVSMRQETNMSTAELVTVHKVSVPHLVAVQY